MQTSTPGRQRGHGTIPYKALHCVAETVTTEVFTAHTLPTRERLQRRAIPLFVSGYSGPSAVLFPRSSTLRRSCRVDRQRSSHMSILLPIIDQPHDPDLDYFTPHSTSALLQCRRPYIYIYRAHEKGVFARRSSSTFKITVQT